MASHRILDLSKLSSAAMAGLLGKRNRSVDSGVSISFPNLSKSSVLPRAKQMDQTKPNRPLAREAPHPKLQAPDGSANAQFSKSDLQTAPPPSHTIQNLPESSVLSGAEEFAQTNPNLSARQLAAARLLVTGMRVPDVAKELGITRQTVGVWNRCYEFRKELYRLHRMLAAQDRAT